MGHRHVTRLSLALATGMLAATAAAQDAPTFAESFYAIPLGDAEDVSEQCARSFSQPLTNSGAFVGRTSSEVSEVISSCVESRLSADFSRACDLAIAQSEVDYVVLSEAREIDGSWLFEVVVQRPSMDASVWASDAVASGESPVLLAREQCSALGQAFVDGLAGEGVGDGPGGTGPTPDATPTNGGTSPNPTVIGTAWQSQGGQLYLTTNSPYELDVRLSDAAGRTHYCLQDGLETPEATVHATLDCHMVGIAPGSAHLIMEDVLDATHEADFLVGTDLTSVEISLDHQDRGGWRAAGWTLMLGSVVPVVAGSAMTGDGIMPLVYGVGASLPMLIGGAFMLSHGLHGANHFSVATTE